MLNPQRWAINSRITVSELSGKQNIVLKAKELGLELSEDGKEAQKLLDHVKPGKPGIPIRSGRGFLRAADPAGQTRLSCRLSNWWILCWWWKNGGGRPPATITAMKCCPRLWSRSQWVNEIIHTAAEGNGPVNALDAALRKALLQFYPDLAKIKLVDYKVRILEESAAPAHRSEC